MFKKHWLKVIIVILLLIMAYFFINKYLINNTKQAEGFKINPGNLYEVKKDNLQKTIAVSGYIDPVNEREVSFQTRNSNSRDTVSEVKVEEGQKINKGDLLVVLDKTQENLSYLQAQNEYKRAEINGSKNEIKEAEINLNMARDDLAATELKAPISGLITDVLVDEGDNVSGGEVAVKIIDNSQYEVEVNIPETDIPLIKKGLKTIVSLDALPGKALSGQVVQIGQQAEQSSGVVTVPVKILLEKGNFQLKPGYSADVDIIVDKVSDQIVIPITAILNQNGKEFVKKYENGKLKSVPVQTGLSNGLKIAIQSGLNVGDKIMLNTVQFSQQQTNQSQGHFGPPMRR